MTERHDGGSLDPQEIRAALETRRELGQEYDAAMAEAFADRIEAVVEKRRAEVAAPAVVDQDAGNRQFVLGIVSLGCGIPITAIATSNGGLSAMLVAWGGIVGVNLAHSLANRPRDQRR